MRFPLIPALILLLINAIVDATIYNSIISYYKKCFWSKLQLVTSVLFALLVIVLVCLPKRNGADEQLVVIMWGLYAYLTVYIPKYIYIIFYFLSRLPRLFHRHSWRWLAAFGAIVAFFVFAVMWWGALINRYNTQVVEEKVEIANLPKAFDGFTIAQISDLHVGTYGHDTAFVAKVVDEVNALHPDMIVFTGDIVNRHSVELEPFMKPFSRLKAKYGVYSVLGNHDYGDYSDWPSAEAKAADVEHLKQMQAQMGWHMLNNSHQWIHVGNDSIALIGVENIGDPPFKIYGNLKEAYSDIDDDNVKILLSHNPAHWEHDLADNPASNIALTLSGHTHAMQMEIFGWSPAEWRYDKWGGMYADDKNQKLYVNIGAGEVGMPYRIGATPEITLFTLTPQEK